MTDQQQEKFDPANHLTNLKGNPYLEVKWRLKWFREEFPNGTIVTTMQHFDMAEAVVRAEVTAITENGEIRGSSTGFGSEERSQFGDFIEKAETKAVGRALGMLGFGTQFADDFDDVSAGMLADAPVAATPRRASQNAPQRVNNGNGYQQSNAPQQRPQGAPQQRQGGSPQAGPGPVSPAQLKFIHSMADERTLDKQALHDLVMSSVGVPIDDLTKQQASAVIDRLKEIPPNVPDGPNY